MNEFLLPLNIAFICTVANNRQVQAFEIALEPFYGW